MTWLLPIEIITFVALATVGLLTCFTAPGRPPALAVSKEQTAIGRSEGVHARRTIAVPVTVEEFGIFSGAPCSAHIASRAG